ncbi:MAG: hypothetical protein MUP76_01300 [Acidimicrobiia bacterium]|nr:hypothetical protein [Acidimicrobiia bacterium]
MKPTAAALFACLMAITACSEGILATTPAPPVTHAADGISFSYPAAWRSPADVSAGDGTAVSGPAVGYLDGAGNLIGLAVETQAVDPAVPFGEEQSYLDAVFSRHAAEIWGEGTVREEDWSEVDGRPARRSVVEHTARGELLISEVLIAVEGGTLVIVQCQAPAPVFDLLTPRCASVVATLRIDWDGEDSGAATGS